VVDLPGEQSSDNQSHNEPGPSPDEANPNTVTEHNQQYHGHGDQQDEDSGTKAVHEVPVERSL
jgi:hypothetical protein